MMDTAPVENENPNVVDDRDMLERGQRLSQIMNEWINNVTPEQRGWRLERALQLVRNQALAQQMLRRITDDQVAIGNALKSYKRYRKPYE